MVEANCPTQAAGADGGQDQKGPPEINAKYEGHRIYRLVNEDEKALERTAREIIEGNKLLSNGELWLKNFRAIAAELENWCEGRREKISLALADIRSNKVLFYFVPTGGSYDMSLGQEMTDLEIKISGTGGIGYIETLQVPERSIDRFVGPRSLLIWQSGGSAAPAL